MKNTILIALLALLLCQVVFGSTIHFNWTQNTLTSSREFAGLVAAGANITGVSAVLTLPEMKENSSSLGQLSKFLLGYWIGLSAGGSFVQAGLIPVITTEQIGTQSFYTFVGWESFFMYMQDGVYLWPQGNVTFYSQGFPPSEIRGLVDASRVVEVKGGEVNVTVREVRSGELLATFNGTLGGKVVVRGSFDQAMFEVELYPPTYPNGTQVPAPPPTYFPNITFYDPLVFENGSWITPVVFTGFSQPLGIEVTYTGESIEVYRAPLGGNVSSSPYMLRELLAPLPLTATLVLAIVVFPRRLSGK
ncbi:hypothetical protein HS1genome_1247 [Sulfodiicoccus acidiphilus]|uniref:Uncharacterized protein n=1 Tax=Sulfodiicoccus acidiphilus TaxID=1670455 RepID=A0A348B3V6_9CREN|nr:hypothetical protein [Sulfodiicoccus acidiphilus]BBD72858.1 hypothetical protein HS1genome_1247 [Sulfodiicoccus acidiphilus]GGT88432.1 hypothetical protein GCM10007116_03040 [Sulfodiicoccus acidiphilus]